MLRMRPMSKKVSLNTIANSTLGNRWGCRRQRTTSSQREPRIASIERPLARYAISDHGVGGAGRWVGGAGELGGRWPLAIVGAGRRGTPCAISEDRPSTMTDIHSRHMLLANIRDALTGCVTTRRHKRRYGELHNELFHLERRKNLQFTQQHHYTPPPPSANTSSKESPCCRWPCVESN